MAMIGKALHHHLSDSIMHFDVHRETVVREDHSEIVGDLRWPSHTLSRIAQSATSRRVHTAICVVADEPARTSTKCTPRSFPEYMEEIAGSWKVRRTGPYLTIIGAKSSCLAIYRPGDPDGGTK